jgi:hypothetical protein
MATKHRKARTEAEAEAETPYPKVKIGFAISPEGGAALKKMAADSDITVSTLVRWTVEELLEGNMKLKVRGEIYEH